MTVRQPLWWSVGLMAAGIMADHTWPSALYLPAACLILLLATLMQILHRGRGWWLLLFWAAFGAAHMHMEDTLPNPTQHVWQTVQARAKQQNDAITARLQQAGLHSDARAIVPALLLGRREEVTSDTRQAYSSSGAAHLLALSGLHLGILYGLLHLLVLRRLRHSQWRWFALPPLLLLVWGYVLLAGMPLSLVRAAVMCTAVMIATLAHRALSPMHALALSAWVILAVSPGSLFSLSGQLSFLAVLFILAARPQRVGGHKRQNRIVQGIVVSAAAWLGTAPLAAYHFHTLPLLAIPLSMLLIPLTTLIVYLSLALALIPAAPLASALNLLATLQNHVVSCCASLPGATVGHLHPQAWQVAAVYILLLLALVRLEAHREQKSFPM